MTDYSDLEAKLLAVKECKDIEAALDRCKFGILNKGVVYKIAAETDYGKHYGGAERSVECVLTIEESAEVFDLVSDMLSKRLAAAKKKLGI